MEDSDSVRYNKTDVMLSSYKQLTYQNNQKTNVRNKLIMFSFVLNNLLSIGNLWRRLRIENIS